jgi:hypothetical protein
MFPYVTKFLHEYILIRVTPVDPFTAMMVANKIITTRNVNYSTVCDILTFLRLFTPLPSPATTINYWT